MEVRSYEHIDDFIFCYEKYTSGQSTSHAHAGIELHFCYEGSGQFAVRHFHHPLIPGRLTLLYGPAQHCVTSDPRKHYCRTVLHIPDGLVENSLRPLDIDRAMVLPTANRPLLQFLPTARDLVDIRRIFRQIRGVLRLEHDRVNPRVALYLAELFCLLHESGIVEYSENRFKDASPHDHQLVEQAIALCDSRPASELSPHRLATELGVSRGHLWRVFNSVLGISPAEYLLERRMEQAKRELAAGRPVTAVASLCGYNEVSSFRRTFKNYVGVSPSEYARIGASCDR